MRWSNLWPYAQTWWGWTVAALTVLGAVYYAPKKMFETWDYYMDRFLDWKVRDYMGTRLTDPFLTQHGPVRYPLDTTLEEISKATGLSIGRVRGCLGRMAKKNEVVQSGTSWKVKSTFG